MLTRKNRGFTIVEVAIIAPMMILVVLGIMALLIILVSDNASQSAKNTLIHDTQAAFKTTETDVGAANSFLPSLTANFTDGNEPGATGTYKTQGTLTSGTASVDLNTLYIRGYNQVVDPNDTTGTKTIPAFIGSPPCNNNNSSPDGRNVVPVVTIYFVKDGVLYRRTIVDNTGATTCETPLRIKQTCPTVDNSATPPCPIKDTPIISGVTKFKVAYYLNPSDTTEMDVYAATPSTTVDSAQSVIITLTATKASAGDTISYTGSLKASRLSNF